VKALLALALKLAAALLLLSLLWAGAYRFINPPATWLTIRDRLQGTPVQRQWVGLDRIAADLPRAAIAAEDSGFCGHHGFDFAAIERALASNRDGGRLRGGSTISQQTAKNAFLWPGRNFVRKAAEGWFTLLIETLWGKRRIMEVYLNVAEFGRGVFGAEAAARHYFGKPASALSRAEAARLAAILPQPIRRSAATPGPYTRRYAGRIEARIRVVQRDGLDSCLR